MTKVFKFSTFVTKLLLFSFIVASFALSSARAADKSENEKMVLQTVRLSLWYQGINSGHTVDNSQNSDLNATEELQMAIMRHERERKSTAFDTLK